MFNFNLFLETCFRVKWRNKNKYFNSPRVSVQQKRQENQKEKKDQVYKRMNLIVKKHEKNYI